jgi:putative FmdB family regulatory protein
MTMAFYEYECHDCGHDFTVEESFEEHDQHQAPECPKCGSHDVGQLLSEVHVKTSKKT